MYTIHNDTLKSIFSTTITYEEAWIGSIRNTLVASSISAIGLQIAFWCERKLKQGYTEWQGNSPLAGMAIALHILQRLLHWPPCQRRTALWFSPWNAPYPSLISLISCFTRKSITHHSAVARPSYSSFVLTLFLALHHMLPWQIYRAKMGNQNLDMLLDILPNQDNASRRYSSTPTFLVSTLYWVKR